MTTKTVTRGTGGTQYKVRVVDVENSTIDEARAALRAAVNRPKDSHRKFLGRIERATRERLTELGTDPHAAVEEQSPEDYCQEILRLIGYIRESKSKNDIFWNVYALGHALREATAKGALDASHERKGYTAAATRERKGRRRTRVVKEPDGVERRIKATDTEIVALCVEIQNRRRQQGLRLLSMTRLLEKAGKEFRLGKIRTWEIAHDLLKDAERQGLVQFGRRGQSY